jgi:hypothetical protein
MNYQAAFQAMQEKHTFRSSRAQGAVPRYLVVDVSATATVLQQPINELRGLQPRVTVAHPRITIEHHTPASYSVADGSRHLLYLAHRCGRHAAATTATVTSIIFIRVDTYLAHQIASTGESSAITFATCLASVFLRFLDSHLFLYSSSTGCKAAVSIMWVQTCLQHGLSLSVVP